LDYSNRENTIVYIGSDHAGYSIKKKTINYVKSLGYTVIDLGTDSEESVDYPDYGVKVARKVRETEGSCGIIFCGTGIGISIAANKIPGIRAALCTTEFHVEMARRHNDANILAMGARVSSFDDIKDMIKMWFATPFEGGRHQKRVKKIHLLTGC
jgi:ribose 5-phosphate isomerase B